MFKNFVKNNKSTKKGNAFAVDNRNKLAVFGGDIFSSIVDLTKPEDVLMLVDIKTPNKWFVNNFDWDPLVSNRDQSRYLQTVRFALFFLLLLVAVIYEVLNFFFL